MNDLLPKIDIIGGLPTYEHDEFYLLIEYPLSTIKIRLTPLNYYEGYNAQFYYQKEYLDMVNRFIGDLEESDQILGYREKSTIMIDVSEDKIEIETRSINICLSIENKVQLLSTMKKYYNMLTT